MHQSELKKVSEALRDELASAPFTKEFEPLRSFVTDMQLTDDDTLHVDVVPVSQAPEQRDRGDISWTSTIDIGVRFKFGNLDQEEDSGKIRNRHMDEWIAFMQEIVEFLYNTPQLANYPEAELLPTVVVRSTYSSQDLRDWGQFTGIIRAEYRSETLLDGVV
jgi:hypothetical protein